MGSGRGLRGLKLTVSGSLKGPSWLEGGPSQRQPQDSRAPPRPLWDLSQDGNVRAPSPARRRDTPLGVLCLSGHPPAEGVLGFARLRFKFGRAAVRERGGQYGQISVG